MLELAFNNLTTVQEWTVDMWANTDQSKLAYLRKNQKKFKADKYKVVQDAIREGENARDVGRRFILPSTFIGSDRFMQQLNQVLQAFLRAYHG